VCGDAGGIRAVVVELALKYPMWGHRKIAWLARHEHGLHVAEATACGSSARPA